MVIQERLDTESEGHPSPPLRWGSSGVGAIVDAFLSPLPPNQTLGIENKDALMPDCGVHYLWFAFVCFLIRSPPPPPNQTLSWVLFATNSLLANIFLHQAGIQCTPGQTGFHLARVDNSWGVNTQSLHEHTVITPSAVEPVMGSSCL